MRLKSGIDLWECENCGEAVIMGRRCPKCGTSYADQLKAEHRKPAKERQFTKSYLFKKKGKKNEM